MKKAFAVLLTVFCVFSLCACAGKTPGADSRATTEAPGTVSFRGTVLESDGTVVTVRPDADSYAARSSDRIEASLREAECDFTPQPGDTVEILHEGGIMECYPARLEKTLKITLIAKAENADTSAEPEEISGEPSETAAGPAAEETEAQPGTDAEKTLVNLRGDFVTVTLRADGTWSDGENVYVFNGAETWTDENGAEWNEALPVEKTLVNLRGDFVTVTLRADGAWSDGENVYVFDGAETWTDENGAEWNEALN